MFSRNALLVMADALLIAVSVFLAWTLARTDILIHVLEQTRGLELLGSFIAGMFFTSAFTVAPAAATLGELSLAGGVFWTVICGTLGSLVGDALIFRFVQNRFVTHLSGYVRAWGGTSRLERFFKRPSTRWVARGLGALVLASPLPDELGIALLGVSRLPASWFLPLAAVANAFGIALVCLAARAL